MPAADPIDLVIASGNAGKVREFAALLADLPLRVQPQPAEIEVEETGDTFAENARLKAQAVARASGCWALADDSGLAVDALGGAPGVHSARYADSDAARIERLLTELEGAPERGACFVCALALADPSGAVRLEVEGRSPGRILEAPQGSGGFGYDPVFLPEGTERSFAEMTREEKARLGHRGRAFSALEPQLRQLLGGG
ncbi:MAG: RdgB/HAM1 family non-canonical purine NTP pyrophosphatase [Cyanobacteriota bacterium]|nr:RdgB/HAM1 family non-canonical purine NTP pyrophosphatase [Cyanobacteriota bacterium]